jgi:hypothetical protein
MARLDEGEDQVKGEADTEAGSPVVVVEPLEQRDEAVGRERAGGSGSSVGAADGEQAPGQGGDDSAPVPAGREPVPGVLGVKRGQIKLGARDCTQ